MSVLRIIIIFLSCKVYYKYRFITNTVLWILFLVSSPTKTNKKIHSLWYFPICPLLWGGSYLSLEVRNAHQILHFFSSEDQWNNSAAEQILHYLHYLKPLPMRKITVHGRIKLYLSMLTRKQQCRQCSSHPAPVSVSPHLPNPGMEWPPKTAEEMQLWGKGCVMLSCHITPQVSRDAPESPIRWNCGVMQHLAESGIWAGDDFLQAPFWAICSFPTRESSKS